MRSSDVIGVHVENFVYVDIYRFRGWIEQLLQLVVQPHLDGQPLPDETHLMRAVLGGEEFLPALLHLALLGKVDPQAGATGRSFTVIHGLNATLHRALSCPLRLRNPRRFSGSSRTVAGPLVAGPLRRLFDSGDGLAV